MKRISIILVGCLILSSLSGKAQTITTIAGTGIAGWSGDGGAATAAQINSPSSIAVDRSGNVFFADRFNNRVRMIDSYGLIREIAGNGIAGFSGNGGPASAAKLDNPTGLAIDDSNNLYISDYNNQVVRKVSPSVGGTITTFAGIPGSMGYSGDGGAATAATFYRPYGMSFDSHGNLYVADQYNHVVRKIAAGTHIISTFAGNAIGTFGGDGGPASACSLFYPDEVCVDRHDNVFIADVSNQRIRRVNTSGIITTVAGTGTSGFSGDGGPATAADLYFPGGLRIDSLGNIFFEVFDNHIRWINTSGIIQTICGDGVPGYSGDGGPATAAEINQANDVALDFYGDILIADQGNNRIRKFGSPVASLGEVTIDKATEGLKLYPNPGNGSFKLFAGAASGGEARVVISNIAGQVIKELHLSTNTEHELSLDAPAGLYFVTVATSARSYTGKLILIK